ncbi:MAG: hypothetical protein ACRDBO_10845 [Lachnospiraceae bacterium]
MFANIFGAVPMIPEGLLHTMYLLTKEKNLSTENGGQWSADTESKTEFKGVVLPVGSEDLVRAEGGATTNCTEKVYTNEKELPVGAQILDPPTGYRYTVAQELGHNSLHPMKRYLIERGGKAGS